MANAINAMHWRSQRIRYRLQGVRCENCGGPVFPPRPRCPRCIERNRAQSQHAKGPEQRSWQADALWDRHAYEIHHVNPAKQAC
jgi:hypothetical protein